jgi:hypothetical protein
VRQAPLVPLQLASVHPTAGPARAHRRPVGANASAPASAEATHRPSGGRSSPDRRGYAVGRPHQLVPFVNCPSTLGPGRRWPVAINAGAKRGCGHASCTSSFREKPRSLLPPDLISVTVVLEAVREVRPRVFACI